MLLKSQSEFRQNYFVQEFTGDSTLMLKCNTYMEITYMEITKNDFKKDNNRGLKLLYWKHYSKSTILTQHVTDIKDRSRQQWNSLGSLEIELCIYGHSFLKRMPKQFNGKTRCLQKIMQKQVDVIGRRKKKTKKQPICQALSKRLNKKWNRYLLIYVRVKILKLPENNYGEIWMPLV